eukprot:5901206-Alexandrium_andersonii.AAC.1
MRVGWSKKHVAPAEQRPVFHQLQQTAKSALRFGRLFKMVSVFVWCRTSYPRHFNCLIVSHTSAFLVRWLVSKAMIRGNAPSCLSQYCMTPRSTLQSAPSQS